jgi:excisionase family DNA binding protein
MENNQTNEKAYTEILSFKEVQELLGVSRSFLYKKTSQNKIPCYRPTRGKLFFKLDEILEWLNSNQDESNTSTNL